MDLSTKDMIIIFVIMIFVLLGKMYDYNVRSEAMAEAIENAEKYEIERQLEVYGRNIQY